MPRSAATGHLSHLKHPLVRGLEKLIQHPYEPLTYIELAHAVNQFDELKILSRSMMLTTSERRVLQELEGYRDQAVQQLSMEWPGHGNLTAAADCLECVGSSNCIQCFHGYTIDLKVCITCRGSGACQKCSSKNHTIWDVVLDDMV
jgi:hypothetical protein